MYFGFSKREEFYYAVEKGEVILPENIHKLLKEKTDNVLFKYVKQALRVATKATTGKKEEGHYTDRKMDSGFGLKDERKKKHKS